MERKGGISTDVVTVDQVRSLLPHTRTLSVEEERALRMRHGVSVDPAAPLPRAAGGNAELEDELLVMEMQLLRAQRERMKVLTLPNRSVVDSPTKSKIVRALRKKK